MRFIVFGAPTMMELVHMMNEHVSPESILVYFGANKGDYTGHPEQEKLQRAKYIAIFDSIEINSSLVDFIPESNVVMSA